jgi:AcrR family transcriptional regulator
MEIVAREANITKRTLYMRYNDKGELFADAIRKAKDGWDFPDVELVANQNKPLASQLLALAEALLKHTLNPKVIKLARIASAQADNFPEEIRGKYNIASSPRIVSVVKVLKLHENNVDPTYFNDIEMTAELFIGLISGIPARYAGMGMIRDPGLEKRRIKLAVDLFVEGIGKKQ